MKEKKIGIVGLGVMGKHIGRELRVASGGLAKVIAVVEPSDEKFSQGCEFLGYEPLRCDTTRDMLVRSFRTAFTERGCVRSVRLNFPGRSVCTTARDVYDVYYVGSLLEGQVICADCVARSAKYPRLQGA